MRKIVQQAKAKAFAIRREKTALFNKSCRNVQLKSQGGACFSEPSTKAIKEKLIGLHEDLRLICIKTSNFS